MIIDASANMTVAARRISQLKFLNAGQTCVAPDYALVEAKARDRFVAALRAEVIRSFTEDPQVRMGAWRMDG